VARNDKSDPSPTVAENQRAADAPSKSTRRSRRVGRTAHSAEAERLREIFDHALVGIAQIDLEGRFTFVNRQYCAIVGRSAHELMGMRLQDLTLLHNNSANTDSLETLVSQAQQSVVEKRYVGPEGAEIWVNHGISLVRDESGKPWFGVVVAQDITSRKRREEDLRRREGALRQQAEELEQQLIASGRLVSLGELTASMAHEFNNPLGIILGFTEDIMSDMDSADPNYRSMQIIDEEARRCEKIVKDLLEFARPRSVDFTWTDVAEVIKKTMEMISSRLFKQNVEAVYDIAPDLRPIHADAQQLQQVLANLCLNALDAMPDGGKLTITARQDTDDQLAISVTDTGFGIDHDTRGKIFKPFFTAKKRKGLGLGLPISERIVKAHGGSIQVESEPGQGATFRIRLPVKTAVRREVSSAS
jgi:two-component system sensor histidine kinase AtoS